jgi:small conductance mechanosensitive channel
MLLIFRPFRIGQKVQIGGTGVGTVKELSLFWTELVTDDKVQVLVPNNGVWGQPLRNFSIYPAPPHAGEVRFQIADDTALDRAMEQVRSLVEADPRVLADPAPSVLLDRSVAENALEVVLAFSTADDVTALVKSDLIKTVHEALDANAGKRAAHPA